MIRGAVLAGGGATRFDGRPKGLELVGGQRILDRVIEALTEGLGASPLLVANDPEASQWAPGLRVVSDTRPGLGALGGIYTAIVETPAPVVCVAWDMPFVTAGLVRALSDSLEMVDLCLPESGGPRGVEPLCAIYGPACARAIERAVAEDDLRAIGFHRHVGVGILREDRVRRYGDPDRLFFNVNTAADLTRAQGLA